jgi:FAD/FMN-containing dehydrogenase
LTGRYASTRVRKFGLNADPGWHPPGVGRSRSRDVPSVETLAADLQQVVGHPHVVSDPAVAAAFGHDLTGRFSGRPLLVVSPATTEEVAAVVRACAEARVPLVPQGGHSGMVGGGTPRDGEVVLSLRRLNAIEPVDRVARQVTLGAGVRLEALQGFLATVGLEFLVDHAARSAATIGGMAATNAGGSQAMRHGMMRDQVVGLEAVLADGRVISRLQGLAKDNTGYDLTGLLVGSEGTLGVITRVRLRVAPLLTRRVTVLVGVESLDRALDILEVVTHGVPSVQAVDFFELGGLRRVREHLGLSRPFECDFEVYLVIECADESDPTEQLEVLLEVVGDAVAADDPEGRRRLWRYREALNETVNALGVPHKLDVSVPIAALPRFARKVREVIAGVDERAEVLLWGHLGDGNVHVNVLGPPPDDERVDEAVLELVASLGGSISAEHGIGVAKTRWLSLTRSESEIRAMRAIKQALDPLGMLSPGRLLA